MASLLDTSADMTQSQPMTPESPALPDLIAGIASHRLAAEAAEDPAVPPALAELLACGRDAAVSDLGDQLLDSVRTILAAAGVVEPDDQEPYLEALAESLAFRDNITPEMPFSDPEGDVDEVEFATSLAGSDFEIPGSYIIASTPEGSEADAWFMPLHERPELIH